MSNEEKILALLEAQGKTLEEHGRMLVGLQQDVSGLKGDVAVLKEDVSGLKEDVAVLKEDVSGLKEDVAVLKEDVSCLKEDVAGLQETVTRVALTQENIVLPRLDLLAEGHTLLRDTLAPKDRVEVLEEDVAFLKDTTHSLSRCVVKLEQAR